MTTCMNMHESVLSYIVIFTIFWLSLSFLFLDFTDDELKLKTIKIKINFKSSLFLTKISK